MLALSPPFFLQCLVDVSGIAGDVFPDDNARIAYLDHSLQVSLSLSLSFLLSLSPSLSFSLSLPLSFSLSPPLSFLRALSHTLSLYSLFFTHSRSLVRARVHARARSL